MALASIPVVTSTLLVDRVPVRLPRLRVKTKSVSKAYKRLRKAMKGVVELEVPSATAYQVGGQLVMHPAMVEKVKRAVERVRDENFYSMVDSAKDSFLGTAAPAANNFSMGDVTLSSLMDTMRDIREKFPPVPNKNNDLFLTPQLPAFDEPKFGYYARHEPRYSFVVPPLLMTPYCF